MAARIGYAFGLDPVMVLEETDDVRWAIRVAAFEQYQDDDNTRYRARHRK